MSLVKAYLGTAASLMMTIVSCGQLETRADVKQAGTVELPETSVSGSILNNRKTETSSMDLQFGSENTFYKVKGATVTDMGMYQTDVEFHRIKASKEFKENGTQTSQPFKNIGMVSRFPRQRNVQTILVGENISGGYMIGAIDLGVFLSGLYVNSQYSSGALNYSYFTGKFWPESPRFGRVSLSSLAGSEVTMNEDDYIGQNVMLYSLAFGSIQLSGQVQYTDTTKTHVYTTSDSKGNTDVHTYEELISRKADFLLKVTDSHGRPVKMAKQGEVLTDEEKDLKLFAAFTELLGQDLY